MLIISQNLLKHNLDYPEDTILRYNLAWVQSLSLLEKEIKQSRHEIFLDIPIGRVKPPTRDYSIDEIMDLANKYDIVKYIAVSNISSRSQVQYYKDWIKKPKQFVPKIETVEAVKKIQEICSELNQEEGPMLMLDHDDLYTDSVNQGLQTRDFISLVDKVVNFTKHNNVSLLRTQGVIFSTEAP